MNQQPDTPDTQHISPSAEQAKRTGKFRTKPVSFVRRGNRLNPRRQKVWDELKDQYVLHLDRDEASTSVSPDVELDLAQVYGNTNPLIVEIGTGQGENLAAAAARHRDKNFLAVEVYTPGIAGLLVQVKAEQLENVRAIEANAPEVLAHTLPAGSVSELWIYFPDPWHKKKHHKRRMITAEFLDVVARALAPGGIVRLATDWSGYAEQMRAIFGADPRFQNVHAGERAGQDSPLTKVRAEGLEKEDPLPAADALDTEGGWAPRFEGRVLTNFESKAHRAGREIFDLTFRFAEQA
ncbi:tRNA (guanosine(46)-N7)-methyltransferase TrmB [Micrococcoides hystricis]|uniref:tRNA (guanine-N(7)-)-methyltransferase n=1 Tax=Micrococcoides hystricis TaxID=1572761 RepID=A0ABV6PEA3_9MICC